ncbi:MAG: hypothetical protein ACLFV7_07910 [Phycisphaerae bacterium]
MKELPLSELPRYNPWPARLLGLEPVTAKQRTRQEILREYDRDKYGPRLEYCRQAGGALDVDEVRNVTIDTPPDRSHVISRGEQLYLTTYGQTTDLYEDFVYDALSECLPQVASVIELGSGYGYNLWHLWKRYPDMQYFGGELTRSAVEIGKCLFEGEGANDLPIRIRPFDFLQTPYTLLEELPAPVLVFTSYGVESLSESSVFYNALAASPGRIHSVVMLEPAHQLHQNTTLGLMRRRYEQINDYNLEMVGTLQARSDVEILRLEPHVLGINPLHPTSIMHWRFRGRS